jgi:hypothetical protein
VVFVLNVLIAAFADQLPVFFKQRERSQQFELSLHERLN